MRSYLRGRNKQDLGTIPGMSCWAALWRKVQQGDPLELKMEVSCQEWSLVVGSTHQDINAVRRGLLQTPEGSLVMYAFPFFWRNQRTNPKQFFGGKQTLEVNLTFRRAESQFSLKHASSFFSDSSFMGKQAIPRERESYFQGKMPPEREICPSGGDAPNFSFDME